MMLKGYEKDREVRKERGWDDLRVCEISVKKRNVSKERRKKCCG